MMQPKEILVLSGPNLNLLGQREPEIYGKENLADHLQTAREAALVGGFTIEHLQSNHEATSSTPSTMRGTGRPRSSSTRVRSPITPTLWPTPSPPTMESSSRSTSPTPPLARSGAAPR